ncbi:hypothetical protein [Motilimonas eburnea]|uniref:hypothetical protein n=1 Tax=Motilimonas eburnea TaxID=1737488 RepID=UPI001E3B6CA9|nr:hypothetical protein [Motilimonas eburnea]MCE2572422.1 hypothetical protein [Motilimonas eburnea]
MYYLKKSLICLALPLVTLTACGGSSGSSSTESNGDVAEIPSSQANITTNNASELTQAVLSNSSIGNSSSNMVNLISDQISPRGAARASLLSGSEDCPGGGTLNYDMANETSGKFSFSHCELSSELSFDGGFSVNGIDITKGMLISYDAFNMKMAASALNNYQAMDDTISGTIRLSLFGDAGITSVQNLVRQHNPSGISISSNNLQMSFNGNSLLPDQASGTLTHSDYGSVNLSTSGASLLLTGEASTLKVEQQGGSYVLSLDEDNDGNFEQTTTTTNLNANDLVWAAI